MKLIISLLFIINLNVLYSQVSNDSIIKKIEWLNKNYPNETWMQVSEKTLDNIFNLNLNTKIFLTPLDTLLKENSKYSHIFVKVFYFSSAYYRLTNPNEVDDYKVNKYSFDNVINYYLNLKKYDKEFNSNAIDFYIRLKDKNQLDSYIKRLAVSSEESSDEEH